MADLNQDTDFNQIIERLQTAVTNSGNLKVGIDNLSNNLDQINTKLQVINQRINGILNDIRDREAAVQGNDQEIHDLRAQRDDAVQKLQAVGDQMNQMEQEMRTNIDRIRELESQLQNSAQQEAALREQLARAPNPQAAAAIQQQLDQVMAENEEGLEQLGNEIKRLNGTNQGLQERIDGLTSGHADSEARVQQIQEQMQRLTEENAQLNQQITNAKTQMIAAIRILESITPDNKRELTAKIQKTTQHIQEIEQMLGQPDKNNQGGVQGMLSNLLGSLPKNGIDDSKEFLYGTDENGEPKAVSLKYIKDMIQNDIKNKEAWTADGIIAQRYLDLFNNSNDVDQIEAGIDRLEKLKGIGDINHGGKTRKRRKTKRRTRTRTRKRKYRGGFQYNENTKRKKITTTTGSKRKTRSRRTSRSRRTTNSIRTTSSF